MADITTTIVFPKGLETSVVGAAPLESSVVHPVGLSTSVLFGEISMFDNYLIDEFDNFFVDENDANIAWS